MSHRVFVSEYICGGAWPLESLEGSLAAEGRAMLTAVIEDLVRIPDMRVVTTWDTRLSRPTPWGETTSLEVHAVSAPEQEADLFRELSQRADSVLVIAPEFDSLLADRSRLVEALPGTRLCGCSSQAAQQCGDKLTLAGRLTDSGIETILTVPFDVTAPDILWPFPLVIKPRHGAGSQFTYRIDRPAALAECIAEISEFASGMEFIQQPYVSGVTASAAAIVQHEGGVIDVLPAGRQLVSDDGRFQYLGCDVPGPFNAARRDQIEGLIRDCREAIPGLKGYVGFDLIVPDDPDRPPVVIEINPRLTTGYLAWRQLTPDNLADCIVPIASKSHDIRWHRRLVRFRLDDLDL